MNSEETVRRLLVTANVVPSSPILVPLMMKAIRSSETSVLTRATWRNTPEDGILQLGKRLDIQSQGVITIYVSVAQSVQRMATDWTA
jgi:hypothetical protein